MRYKPFSQKQLTALCWWCEGSGFEAKDALICDGAVRSGKTFCMSVSFLAWSFYKFGSQNFAICGKTIRSLRRNIITPITPVLKELGFSITEKLSQNYMDVSYKGRSNRFYMFGGKDEASAALIQGMTLAGVLFDEVALMPRSFVEQAIARCSVENSTFWFNCNPEYPQHWFYREWIQKASQKNALYLHFTMEDNPSLSKKLIERYKSLYSGAFYQRFICGKWVAVSGAVYPFMDDEEMYYEKPQEKCEKYAISVDYGTVNPTSMGLWGYSRGCWYRLEEYYYNSRKSGRQKTDEEYYTELERLAGGRRIDIVTVDPSAASFIETIERHARYHVVKAKNNVLDGIRSVSCALTEGKIKICKHCTDSRREFSLYRWNETGEKDMPVKENDHAMDDIRYFVSSVLNDSGEIFVFAAKR